jgi:hypothetical protein
MGRADVASDLTSLGNHLLTLMNRQLREPVPDSMHESIDRRLRKSKDFIQDSDVRADLAGHFRSDRKNGAVTLRELLFVMNVVIKDLAGEPIDAEGPSRPSRPSRPSPPLNMGGSKMPPSPVEEPFNPRYRSDFMQKDAMDELPHRRHLSWSNVAATTGRTHITN